MTEPINLKADVPAEALRIIDILTAEVQMTRRNAAVFAVAMQTLAKAVAQPADK